MTQPIISVENLSKAYRLGAKEEAPDTLIGAAKSLVTAPVRNFRELSRLNTFKQDEEGEADDRTLWALKDVSFDVREGEVVGVIGRNGAGKSTLLKILSRITEPTSGRAVIRGRVSSLLEVGTGFHPELSGRDNVYMNGTILGMTKREIDSKFDEIVDFSGVEKFLDTPIKRYSSGMQVRLAFAVAAHLEPEILIVDEVLAVGDMEFQKKCLGKMKDVASGGRTVLFVSHNFSAVEALCSRCLVLQKGGLDFSGDTPKAIERYREKSKSSSCTGNDVSLHKHENRRGGCEPILHALRIRNASGDLSLSFTPNTPVVFEIDYVPGAAIGQLCFAIFVVKQGGRVAIFHSHIHASVTAPAGKAGSVCCEVDCLPLVPGAYDIDVAVGQVGRDVIDYVEYATAIEVVPSDFFGTGALPNASHGPMLIPSAWEVMDASSPESPVNK